MPTTSVEQPPSAPHRRAFFRNWLQDPYTVASVTPSGRMLAKRMAAGLGPNSIVIEIGAGTGTLTDGLRDAGVKDQNLYLVELQGGFADILERRFPAATVSRTDADSLRESFPGLVGRVDCVVSSLPILWFEKAKKLAILESALAMLKPDGFLKQLTYVGRPPISNAMIRELRLTARLDGIAPINFPPAFVYRLSKQLES